MHLSKMLRTENYTAPDDRPLIGTNIVDVNLELGPFLVSTSHGGVLLHPGKVVDGVKGQAPFNWFELQGDPLEALSQYVIDFNHNAYTKGSQAFPNVLTDTPYDEVSLMTAVKHITYYDLKVSFIAIERDLAICSEVDESELVPDAQVVITDQLPSGCVVLSAQPEYVGTLVQAGSSACFIVHNFLRGMFVISQLNGLEAET